jgi:hypothetical protein
MVYRGRVVYAALMAFGSERAACAETVLEPINLSYRAPPACPTFEQFLAEIQRSTPRLRLASGSEAARRFEVEIEDSGRAGQLALGGEQGGVRAVSGPDCRAVAELLAFAVALAADPEAQPAEPTRGVATFPGLVPAPAATPEPTATKAKVVVRPPEPIRTPAAAPVGHRWRWAVAGVGFATGANLPALSWGGGALAELELQALKWAPHLRLSANYARNTLAEAPGQVVLTTTFLSFELCSGSLRRGSFTFLPCLRAQGGARHAQGVDLPEQRGKLRGFFDLGAAGHVRFRFAGPAFVELGAALLFPLVRDTVVILPERSVYEVPALGGLGECALGVEFGDQTRD